MAKLISRRDFLKGTAAGALGLAAGSLFGTPVQAKAEGPGGPGGRPAGGPGGPGGMPPEGMPGGPDGAPPQP